MAFDMMMTLQEERNKLTDAAAQKYLVNCTAWLTGITISWFASTRKKRIWPMLNQRVSSEIEQIQQDPSLSDDEKFSRKRDLKRKYFDESQKYSVSAKDIDETVKSLRDLLASGAAS